MMRTSLRSLVLACAVITCALTIMSPARAVIIGTTGDGTGNTAQGSMVAGWDNVGTVDNASAVYLGNGWVITAKHVGGVGAGTQVNFDSAGTFTSDGNVVRLTTPGHGLADLQMFHLTATPSLPTLTIATASPTAGKFIYMVGYGRNRAEDPVYYDVTGPPDNYSWSTPRSDATGAEAGGFEYASGNTKRWGTNMTTDDPGNPGNPTAIADAGFGPTQVFFANFYDSLTDYQNGGGTDYEAQLSNGDSGGGIFDENNKLIGLINYKGIYSNQPDDTALFGNYSEMADLSAYRTQILDTMNSTVPEPTSLALLAVGGLALLSRKRHG